MAGGSPNAQTSLSLPNSLSPVIVATYVTAYASPDSIFPATYDPNLSVWSTPDGYVCSPGDDGCYFWFWVRAAGGAAAPASMHSAPSTRHGPMPLRCRSSCGPTWVAPAIWLALAVVAPAHPHPSPPCRAFRLSADHAAACGHAVLSFQPSC